MPGGGYLLSMLRMILSSLLLAGRIHLGACAAGSADGQAPINTSTPRSPPATGRAASGSDSTTWLVSDTAAKTAQLSITVTRPAGAESALLNGHRRGAARVIVPVGWT